MATRIVRKMSNETIDLNRFLKEHPFLAQLIPKNGTVFECYGDAPAPSKDYGQLELKIDRFVLRWWKITLRNIEGSIYPGEIKENYEDFYHDEVAHREVWRIFGPKMLEYCRNLVRGHIDWLIRLPLDIQIKIFSYIDLEDIPQLSLVCKTFRSICRHNDLWKLFYMRQHGRHSVENKDLIHLAERRGWRHVYFTNRLKLQMQLRREAQLDRQSTNPHRNHQPSPPTTPRDHEKQTIRRHSFANRREKFNMSPIRDRENSARSLINEDEELVRVSSAGLNVPKRSSAPRRH